MNNISIVGVPEHFNMPWHQLISEQKDIWGNTINLEWKDIPGGTGAMVEEISSGKADLGVLLTEGAVKCQLENSDFKIVQPFIISPLLWGIHTGIGTSIEDNDQLFDYPFAISRYNSGSHLMANVMAKSRGVTKELSFEVIGNLSGAVERLKNDPNHIFLWEKYTTKPFVDKGSFNRVGVFPTPWPCFVLVASNRLIEKSPHLVATISSAIIKFSKKLVSDTDTAIKEISEKYSLNPDDLREWYSSTEWFIDYDLKEEVLSKAFSKLKEFDVIQRVPDFHDLVF